MRKDPKGNPLPVRFHWKNGRYWYVYRNRWHPLSSSYHEAMSRYARLVSPSSGMADLVDKVMRSLQTKGKLAANTLTQYERAAKDITTAFHEFDPSEIKQTHVSQWHDHMASTTPNMANRCLSVLRIVMDHAVRWGMADHNPALGVKRAEESKRTRYLEDWEFKSIRSQARPWVQCLMDVLYLTGQRVGDVLAMKRQDVTDEGVVFQQQKTGTKLRVAMTPELRAAITEATRLGGGFVTPYIWHPRGKREPYSYFSARDAYRLACIAAGVEDTTLHDLRAKSLTDAKRAGLDATALAGHTSPAMTQRYIRLRETKDVTGPNLRQRITR